MVMIFFNHADKSVSEKSITDIIQMLKAMQGGSSSSQGSTLDVQSRYVKLGRNVMKMITRDRYTFGWTVGHDVDHRGVIWISGLTTKPREVHQEGLDIVKVSCIFSFPLLQCIVT